MKKLFVIALVGGTMALASCGGGPSAEEKAATEQARLDSIKAAEQAKLDAEAEAAAAAAAAEAEAEAAEAENTEAESGRLEVDSKEESPQSNRLQVKTEEEKKAQGTRLKVK